MEKKQSSVDLILNAFNLLSDSDFKAWMLNNYDEIKAMHKEEMFEYIKQKYCIGRMSLEFHTLEFEQYYNETFGGQDNE